MNFFGKASKKSKKTTSTTSDEDNLPQPSSRSGSGSRSPQKKSTSSKSSKARDENYKAEQGSSKDSRRSRKTGRHPSRDTIDPNEHPLNWPPEHRLSVLSTMSEPTAMDIDSETPSSPPPQTNMPGAFDTPKTNGTKVNGEGPAPPPHKTPTSPPPAAVPTPEDAEAFKTAGNKLYKAGEYKKAIEQYTKGTSPETVAHEVTC
jgi:DnaJ family protein C protein 7